MFDRLVQGMNRTIDRVHSVRGDVQIVPWLRGTYDAGDEDTSRSIVIGPGVLFYGQDSVVPVAGLNDSRMLQYDVWLSINTELLDASRAQQGDRVIANGELFEINTISHDGLGRSRVYMIRAKP